MTNPTRHTKIPTTFTQFNLSLNTNIATGTKINEATTLTSTAAIPKFQPERYVSKKPNSIPTIAMANPMLAQLSCFSSKLSPFLMGKKMKVSKTTANATLYVTKRDTVKLTFDGVLLAVK